jgi:hypothetical protein
MMELYERRGQTAQEFVALTFGVFQSSEQLKEFLDADIYSGVLGEGLLYYPKLRYWAEHYAAVGTDEYSKDFADAWTRIMNADRFQGPLGNVCAKE